MNDKIVILQCLDCNDKEIKNLIEILQSLNTNFRFLILRKKITALTVEELEFLLEDLKHWKQSEDK